MSKFSASEEIMNGMGPEKSEEERRLAMETDENTEALPSVPGDKNPADGAPLSKEASDGTVGEDGAPVYPDPKEKSDAEMAAKPDDVLNQEVAKEMGAAGTIEDAIKRVVVQAIKEAATPEGHVNKQAVDTMGAVKMSQTMSYRGFTIELEDEDDGGTAIVVKGKDFGSGEVVGNIKTEYASDAFRVGKQAIDELLEKSKFSSVKMASEIQKKTGTITLQIPYEVWIWSDGQFEFKSTMNASGQNSSDTLEEHAIKVVKSKLGLL